MRLLRGAIVALMLPAGGLATLYLWIAERRTLRAEARRQGDRAGTLLP